MALRPKRAGDRLIALLRQVDAIEAAAPAGAMSRFFRVRGAGDDSLALAKRLATEAGLGLAPGVGFGAKAKAACDGASPPQTTCSNEASNGCGLSSVADIRRGSANFHDAGQRPRSWKTSTLCWPQS